eukprot:scaffold22575_cov47-Phaeocystis_antarctica.AAC.2
MDVQSALLFASSRYQTDVVAWHAEMRADRRAVRTEARWRAEATRAMMVTRMGYWHRLRARKLQRIISRLHEILWLLQPEGGAALQPEGGAALQPEGGAAPAIAEGGGAMLTVAEASVEGSRRLEDGGAQQAVEAAEVEAAEVEAAE